MTAPEAQLLQIGKGVVSQPTEPFFFFFFFVVLLIVGKTQSREMQN
jgi:hypothetical protein